MAATDGGPARRRWDDPVLEQHPGGGAPEQEILQPCLPPAVERLDHGQEHDAEAEGTPDSTAPIAASSA